MWHRHWRRASERIPSNVSLVVGDAGSYDYDEGVFDAIIANFGIMFFQDNEAAFRNLRRAVKQGGRMAATVWATAPENPRFSMPRGIVDEKIPDVPRPDRIASIWAVLLWTGKNTTSLPVCYSWRALKSAHAVS